MVLLLIALCQHFFFICKSIGSLFLSRLVQYHFSIMQYYKSFTLLSFASVALAQQCTLQFDGRVATGTEAEAFDAENNLFSPQNVFGAGLSFSKVLQLPNEASSPFDGNDNVPLEVTIRSV